MGNKVDALNVVNCPASVQACANSQWRQLLDRMVARRMSNKAIGKELGMAPRTASTHLSNIYQKLGITSRGELADVVRGVDPVTD